MAMLQTMTKGAGEPKGSPAGKAAPADKAAAGKTSPEAIKAHMAFLADDAIAIRKQSKAHKAGALQARGGINPM